MAQPGNSYKGELYSQQSRAIEPISRNGRHQLSYCFLLRLSFEFLGNFLTSHSSQKKQKGKAATKTGGEALMDYDNTYPNVMIIKRQENEALRITAKGQPRNLVTSSSIRRNSFITHQF